LKPGENSVGHHQAEQEFGEQTGIEFLDDALVKEKEDHQQDVIESPYFASQGVSEQLDPVEVPENRDPECERCYVESVQGRQDSRSEASPQNLHVFLQGVQSEANEGAPCESA